MKTISLGGLDVSRVGLGAMGMSAFYTRAGGDEAESIRAIHRPARAVERVARGLRGAPRRGRHGRHLSVTRYSDKPYSKIIHVLLHTRRHYMEKAR